MNMKKYILMSVAILMFQAHAMEQPKELDIWQAIEQDDLARVRELIYKNKVRVRTPDGLTPLMYASWFGKLQIVDAILNAEWYWYLDEVEAQDKSGQTALFRAIQRGHTDVVAYLLAAEKSIGLRYFMKIIGAPLPSNRANSLGVTPLMVAAENGYLEICSLLIQEGANLNAQTKKGTTALWLASYVGHEKIVALLLKNNADPNIHNEQGYTALINAAEQGLADACSLLIDADADIFMQAKLHERSRLKKRTALSCAAMKSRLDCIHRIICGSFFLPSDLALNKESFDRAISCLWSLKQLGMSRDLRNMLVCLALEKDVAAILVSRIKNKQKIPAFAINLMVPVLYNSTAARWAIELPEVQNEMAPITQLINENRIAHCSNIHPCPPAVLDMNNFEANYGAQLRANIKKRLCERYAKDMRQAPAEESQWNDVDFRLDWWI